VHATLRFYAELNDFLSRRRRFVAFEHEFAASPPVKDVIEGCGVPHTEVDLVLVNGEPVGFGHHLCDGDRIAVYPVFEAFDIRGVTRVRPTPLRRTAFVLDVHLGKLARHLRLAGFDALYATEAGDDELARASVEEGRILLTRDQALLKRRAVTHGFYVRETAPIRQLSEVVRRFDLRRQVRPFTRCTCCNGRLEPVDKASVARDVPARSWRCFDVFLRCAGCGRVYWKGSHAARLEHVLARALADGAADRAV
jgi:uncharacterized protein